MYGNVAAVSDGMVGYVPQALIDTADTDIKLLTDNSHDWVSNAFSPTKPLS